MELKNYHKKSPQKRADAQSIHLQKSGLTTI
jgi:hypothetical protein